ncbi:ATP-binding protein [Halovenus marina]|uniref:ATP-binding protein n=1 Tax=Halovenus marina TaxID=3396621 RepID=UPI003F5585CA
MIDIETTRQEHHQLQVDADTVLARQTATAYAEAVGFPEQAVSEVGVVASELGENIIKHADSGQLVVSQISADDRAGIRLESVDVGPGIDDVDAAFADGVSTAGTLGSGLGAVNRLMDRVTVSGEPIDGTRVVADRWVKPTYERTMDAPVDVGAATRPKVPNEPNGDSFVLKRWDDSALFGVIDGLGHGKQGQNAATAAQAYVERHFDRPFEELFEGTDRACRGTRGVVMALARFDWRERTVTVAGVGNVSMRLDGDGHDSIPMRRGVVGGNSTTPLVETVDWQPDDRLVIHSDGVKSRWGWDDWSDIAGEPAAVQARTLLDRYGKDDDATVLVVAGTGR